jgi:DNA adenine methylase
MAAALDGKSRLNLKNGFGVRPPLKWAGGKRWLVPHLEPIWQAHKKRRLVEPFAGGLAVALGLLPEKALLSDINPHAINFYRWLKSGFVNELEMANDETSFYDHRERFNELVAQGKIETREAAELFFYLNRTAYNGLCRFNKSGHFNVPFGRYADIKYDAMTGDFELYKQIFAEWEFCAGDFASLKIESGDFIYADPPYDVQFTAYAREKFGWADQVRLAEWLCEHKGPVVLSNQATDRIIELYENLGYKTVLLDAPRRISCTGDRTKAVEVLATRGI